MKKENESTNIYENIFTIIALLLILTIIIYVAAKLIKTNNLFYSNEVVNKLENSLSINDKNNTSNTPIEKEIVYTEVEIANYTSTLYDNSQNRMFNIQKAIDILNDTVITAGSEFSFNNTIGPMGEENGYKKANGFDANGKVIQVPAGGMCQVSSTLYNVALLTNMEITERHPHSRRVYYVPQDKDATIYYPSLDLKFINNTGYDIKIKATTDNYSVTISFNKIEQSN